MAGGRPGGLSEDRLTPIRPAASSGEAEVT